MWFESNLDYYKDGDNTGMNSGFDLYVPQDTVFPAKKVTFVDHQIKMTPCSSYKDDTSGFWLMPRSSISKTPLRLANSMGLIDSTYRGNLIAALENTSDIDFTVPKGTRLMQVCLPHLLPFTVKKTDKLHDTERGAGGFGSTGGTTSK